MISFIIHNELAFLSDLHGIAQLQDQMITHFIRTKRKGNQKRN